MAKTLLIKTLGETHGIILCTHILPEVQAVCNRVQIINQGKLVYSSGIDDLLEVEPGDIIVQQASVTLPADQTRDLVHHASVPPPGRLGIPNSAVLASFDLSDLGEDLLDQVMGPDRDTSGHHQHIAVADPLHESLSDDIAIVDGDAQSHRLSASRRLLRP